MVCACDGVIMSVMLTLPAPKHQLMYYACLLVDLCKLLTPFPVALEKALNELFARLPRLDVQLLERLADWLAFHVSNFGFSLEPFGRPWGDAITDALPAAKMEDEGAGEGSGPSAGASVAERMAASPEPRARFVAVVLERMVRLSYLERIEKTIPSAFLPLLPPKPTGCLAWREVREVHPHISLAHLLWLVAAVRIGTHEGACDFNVSAIERHRRRVN